MRPFLAAISTISLLGGNAAAIARLGAIGAPAAAAAATSVEPARLVCNEGHCRHESARRYWYRPYGYYRPYRGPRVRISDGPLGVL